jgi:predicted metal-dependent hydrolase
MAAFTDNEFGPVNLRRSKRASVIRLQIDGRGTITLSLPMRAPIMAGLRFLEESRQYVRDSLAKITIQGKIYQPGDIIGKHHYLEIRHQDSNEYTHRISKNRLIVLCPAAPDPTKLQQTIHTGIAKALRSQAKAYLPNRIATLSQQSGLQYHKLRFSSAGTRWGSCSSEGTVSLNIWLMQLPFELIDYVIIHELCHTKHLNHSPAFWSLVQALCPPYKEHRLALKSFYPYA